MASEEIALAIIGGGWLILLGAQIQTLRQIDRLWTVQTVLLREHHKNHGGEKIDSS